MTWGKIERPAETDRLTNFGLGQQDLEVGDLEVGDSDRLDEPGTSNDRQRNVREWII